MQREEPKCFSRHCGLALNEWFVVFFFPPLSAARSFERGKAIATISVVDGAAGVVRNTMSRTVRLVHFLSN